MRRRVFLSLPIVVPTFLSAKEEDSWQLIESVQGDLFPQTKKYPSAHAFEATRYLKMVAYHDSFDQDDLDFILRGATVLKKRGYKKILSYAKREQILRDFSQSRFGENWISIMINYTLEALFSDPIYGGNKNELGWKMYRHHAGLPRPQKSFAALS